MRRLRKWLPRLLCYLLISLILGGTAYSWNARRLAGNAMPMPFGVGMSVVLSGSMEPTLSVNDLVVIRAQERYQPDDVVVYQEGYHLVIHRIVTIDEETAVTRGDANNVNDEPISIGQIKGRLVAAIPGVGLIVRFLQTLPGVILLLGAIVFLLVRSGRQEKEEKNAELEDIRRQIEELKKNMDEAGEPDSGNESPEEPPEAESPEEPPEAESPEEPPEAECPEERPEDESPEENPEDESTGESPAEEIPEEQPEGESPINEESEEQRPEDQKSEGPSSQS